MFGFRTDSSARLRAIMAELDINVSELAEKSGVSKTTISTLRHDSKRKPNTDTALLLARALGVKTSSIWDDR